MKTDGWSLLWITMVLFCATTVFADGATHTATMQVMSKAPTIDGRIEPGEWTGAAKTIGFTSVDIGGGKNVGLLDARLGATYVGISSNALHIAVVSGLPPNFKLQSQFSNRDSELIWDDCIEIWIDPNRDTRGSGQGDHRYYNLLVNSIGALADSAHDPRRGAPDVGWNCHADVANHIDKQAMTWTMEMSIPLVDLGVEGGTIINRGFGILVARNYKGGPWFQGQWFPHKGAYASWLEYPRIVPTVDAPVVRIESLGPKLFTGEMELLAKITNPGAARQVNVKLHITSSDMPELREQKTIDVAAGGTVEYRFNVPPGRLHEEARHALFLRVDSANSEQTFFNYSTQWTKAPANRWPRIRVGPDPDAAAQIAYYPSHRLLRVRIDPSELGEAFEKIRSAQVSLRTADGATVFDQNMTWEKAPAEREFSVGDLPEGKHELVVNIAGYEQPLKRAVTRKRFAWENNTLGITDKIYPPFEPVRVQGSQVEVVQRKYTLDGLGLWNSAVSLGEELLAGPVRLIADGDSPVVGQGQLVSHIPQAAVFEGRAEHAAVRIKSRTITEIDGVTRVELELTPGAEGNVLKSLWLDVPLKDERAPLWHVCTTGLRNNPAGATPAGSGLVWDSTRFPDGTWYGNFKPYLWLGAEERGVAWFADNDKGWELNVDEKNPERSTPCLSLLRDGGVLKLRVHLIQKPVQITTTRKIVFGLMASPGKPMPTDWRRTFFAAGTRPGYQTLQWIGAQYWGSDQDFSSKYPRHGDLSILDAMRDIRRGVPVDRKAFVRGFDERNFQPGMPVGPKSQTDFLKQLEASLGIASTAKPPNSFTVYWDEFHSTNRRHEEVSTFGNEWTGVYGYGSVSGLAPSHRDFAVWWGAEFVKRGIGLYFDNAFPQRGLDPLTSEAYRLPNGQVQPSAGIWARRDYLRRIWNIHRELSPSDLPTAMVIHMTNTHVLPYMVWGDALLDLEWFYGPEPAQAKYPHELLRAESLGRQTGNLPTALARVDQTKTPEQKTTADRTRWGTLMVHEIRPEGVGTDHALQKILTDFGYGLPQTHVWNYWQKDAPIQTQDDRVKTLLLTKDRQALLLLVTWNSQPADAGFKIDSTKLGFVPTMAIDAEDSGRNYAMENGTLRVPLESYGVRIIRLAAKPDLPQ